MSKFNASNKAETLKRKTNYDYQKFATEFTIRNRNTVQGLSLYLLFT